MVYIYDFQKDLTKLTGDMLRATQYLTFIISIIILCFVLAIVNHSSLLLGQMKDNYSRLFVLGYSHQKMRKILIVESLVIFIIILTSSLLSYILIANQFNRFILIFGEYENIQLTNHSLYLGVLFVFIVYVLIKIIYVFQVERIHPSEVLKLY